jgi:hypothetical protein
MNRRITFLGYAIVLLLALFPSRSRAIFDTGNSLLDLCSNRATFSVCAGEAVGYYDMMLLNGFDCGSDAQRTKAQIADILVQYLREHPVDRDKPASYSAASAYIQAFKCSYNGVPPK